MRPRKQGGLSLTAKRWIYIGIAGIAFAIMILIRSVMFPASMWVSNMAVAAMLMPLAKALLEEGLKPLKSNFGKGLLTSVVACVVVAAGMYGIGTITGLY